MIRNLSSDSTNRDPEIGCTVLAQPFFWAKERWIADPCGFAGSIVRGRYYDTAIQAEAQLWADVEARLAARPFGPEMNVIKEPEPERRYGTPSLFMPRLGQGAFRVLVTDAYQRRCALTNESTLPVLEAAHILPFAEYGPNEVSNGILLRSDFHKLFDLGMITVTPDYRVEVSPRIREEWFNGKAYYRLHGKELANMPTLSAERPSDHFLRWHNENIYQP